MKRTLVHSPPNSGQQRARHFADQCPFTPAHRHERARCWLRSARLASSSCTRDDLTTHQQLPWTVAMCVTTRSISSTLSEPARRVLAQCFAEWQSSLSEGFEAMRENGELAAQADPAELALTMMSALQGGLLMAQAMRSARPLELSLNMALQHMAAYRRRPKQAGRR